MCASVREPESWRPPLLEQRHSAFSGKNKSGNRKNGIECGSERLSGSVRRDSTNTCGAAALSQYPLSPTGRRLFAAVACWCCFLLSRYRSTDFAQNPQHRQINSAAAGDFAAQCQQQNQQKLSTFYSGASPFPSLDGVAAADATPPTHAAQVIPVENKQPPSPSESDSALHAGSGLPSRRGNVERAAFLAVVTAVDSRGEPLARTLYGGALQQQHRHGSIKDREVRKEEKGKTKGERGSPNPLATTEQVEELMQQPGKSARKQRLPSTEFLQSFTGRLSRRRSLLEKLMIGENSSSQSEGNKGQRQPNEGRQLPEEPESNGALESPVQPSATAASPAAPVSTASPRDVSPYIEGDPSHSLYAQRATRRWERRTPAEGRVTVHGRGDGTSESEHHGASPATQDAHTNARALQHATGGARADGDHGASTVTVASSSGVRGLYTVRRRLGSEPEAAIIHRFSTGSNSQTFPVLSTSGWHQKHAPGEGAVEETAPNEDMVGGFFGEPPLSHVSRSRNMRRRRRGRDAPRQSVFGSTWGSTNQEPVAGIIAREHHTHTLLGEEKASARPLLPKREAASVLNDVFGMPKVDATSDRGLSTISDVSPLPTAPLHSVIDVNLPSVAVHEEAGPLAVPPLLWEAQVHQQQLPFREQSGSEALQTTGQRGPYDLVLVNDQLQNGGEVVALPPVAQEEVLEESEDVVPLMRKPYLLRPLRNRQRVLLALTILVNALLVIVFGRLSARLMNAYGLHMSLGYLALSWLGLMAMGENIRQAVTMMANAARLLVEDFNLRRQRHKVLDVAEAIKKIREAHGNAAHQERASEDVYAVDDLGGAGVHIVQHGAESPAQLHLAEDSPWL